MANQTRFRSIIRHINVLNLLLLTIIAVFAAYILPPLLNVKVNYTPPAAKKIVEGKEEKPAVTQSPSAMEYTIIAEQNVFNPERKIPAEKKDEKPLPKPEFVLYGTLITGDTSVAFLDDIKAPYTSPGRGKRQRTLRIGNNLSGYTLSEVYADKVVMTRGEDRIELGVIDASHAKTRDTGTVAAAKQTPAGSGALAARRQAGSGAVSVQQQPARNVPTPVNKAPQRRQRPVPQSTD